MADVKVLMLGGRRCGKSSILASMVKELIDNIALTRFCHISDTGRGQTNGISLDSKKNMLMSFIKDHQRGSHYLVDFNADTEFSTYIFKVKLPSKKGSMSIEFVDAPGESYDPRSDKNERVCQEMEQADVYIIAVETPYLMEADRGKFENVNCVLEICKMFDQHAIFKNEWQEKKVIFVPVKCEKWRNQLDEVTRELKRAYWALMERLKGNSRFSYEVLPVLTAGGISFSEFGAPELLSRASMGPNEFIKCSHLGGKRNIYQVRTEDGEYLDDIEDGDKIIDNKEYIVSVAPFYSWFKTVGEYLPWHCDQLALHILRFLIYKFKKDVDHQIWPAWLTGDLRLNEMKDLLKKLEESHLIKDGGDGIEHIRKLE